MSNPRVAELGEQHANLRSRVREIAQKLDAGPSDSVVADLRDLQSFLGEHFALE